ncbi:hypothetical protein BKA56DRAFT_609435 [Ilyonectria sp. MPI-CAGE-AT-0026]|nr:hypothetical protein BKA56DRAFT_609435 [Ilyonectria sp. MPI-CAGE-AT-0026]
MHTEISASCEFAQPPSHGIAFMMRWLSALATNQGPVCPFARLPVSTRPWPTFPSTQPGDASESSHGYLAVSNKIEPRDLRLVGQVRDTLPSVGSTSALAQDQLLLRFNLCTDQTPPGFGVRPSLSSAAVSAVYSSARGPSIRV